MADKAMAKIKLGKDKNTSVILIKTSSITPPKYPAVIPTASPIVPLITVTSKIIPTSIRAPYTTLLKISLPN